MKNFTTFQDVTNINELLNEALLLKTDPLQHQSLGKNKTIGLVFLNASLRTRLSTQKAATNLGLNTLVLNVNQESWAWEFDDGAVMNGSKVEHIKDAAAVISQYCDIVGIRCFPALESMSDDYSEKVFTQFIKYCTVPVISLESAVRHPLQSFADLLTIKENWNKPEKPKVVLTWAPHIKPLPQAVANSFSEWMINADVDFVITHPVGYELDVQFTAGATVTNNQHEALENADFIYVKNWSSFNDYGKIIPVSDDWLLTNQKLEHTNNAKIMHCLPVRRNVELSDEVLDSSNSLILQQSNNRLFAAQTVIKRILEENFNWINTEPWNHFTLLKLEEM